MRKILVVLTLIFFFLFSPKITGACSIVGDPWFNYDIVIDQSSLPKNVEVIYTSTEYKVLSIINKGREPLYILNQIDLDVDYSNTGIPANYRPQFKLMDSKLYRWSTPRYRDNYLWILDENNPYGGVDLNEGVFDIDGELQQVMKDGRPADIKVPDPQKLTIPAFYQGKPISITGRVVYTLNGNYDPNAYKKRSCGGGLSKNYLLLNLALAIVLVSAAGAYYFKKTGRKR